MSIMTLSLESLTTYKAFSEYGLLLACATLACSFLIWCQFQWMHMRASSSKPLPPGSLGIWPLLGESLEFLRLTRSGKLRDFIETRHAKHGPLFKTSLFGRHTLVDVSGPPLNKFLFANENKLVIDRWPNPVVKLMGNHSLLTVHGATHKRIRLAFSSFLGPDALHKFVCSTEVTVLEFFAAHFDGRSRCEEEDKETKLCIYPLMRSFSFSLACSFLLSLHEAEHIAHLYSLFFVVIKGVISLPVNLPGTRFRAATVARKALDHELQQLLNKRRIDLQEGLASPDQDGLSCLITDMDENNKPLLSDVEIKDNLVTILSAAHDTSAASLTMIFKFLVENPAHFQSIIQEHNEIASTKKLGEDLNWHDVQVMRFSWRFIQETMRILPPVEFAMREVIKEFDYNGYRIPQGWKVLWLPFSSHMKSEVFQEPNLFDPSRFEGSGPPPFSFVPFGGGARSCPGMEFAKMSMLIFLHHLVRKYRWTLVNPDEPIVNDPTPRPKQGLPIKITPLPIQIQK